MYQQVDWQIISNSIARFAHFDAVKKTLTGGVRALKKNEVIQQYEHVEILYHEILENDFESKYTTLFQLSSTEKLGHQLQLLNKEGVLGIDELKNIFNLVEAFDDLAETINKVSAKKLRSFERRNLNQKFIKPFRNLIDTTNKVNIKLHPEIKKLAKELEDIDNKIRSILGEIAKSDAYSGKLQFEGHDIIGDSFVLAVRSDSYNHELGKIRGRSETGFTLYVEPFQIANIGQQRLSLMAKIDQIVDRICREFCAILHHEVDFLFYALKNLHRLDAIQAKARYSLETGGTKPEIVENRLLLTEFFHPLIENPIKNEIVLDNLGGLVISGPNTGGKTATLKCILLSTLFTHFGVYIPAKRAEMPFINTVFYQGNDQQRLSEGLSSFSSEVKSYLQIYEEIAGRDPRDNHLIVIDEIFNSTSSEEASALAIALIDEFKSLSNTFFVISSHHQMFKSIVHTREDFLSAHVGFDISTNMPTYKLQLGTPGASMAITIFNRLVKESIMHNTVSHKAEHILDKKDVNYEMLLQKIADKENSLEKLIQKNKDREAELKNQKKSMEGLLKLKMSDELESFKEDVSRKVNEAEEILRDLKNKNQISKSAVNKKIKAIKDLESQKESDYQQRFPEQDKTQSNKTPYEKLYTKIPSTIKIGQKYFSIPLGKIITVKAINQRKQQATISAGSVAIQTPIDSLREIPGHKKVDQKVTVNYIKSGPTSSCVQDCRGMRLDEFISLVDKAFFDLMKADIPFLEIIHGHGDGILKNWLRKYLLKFSDLSWEPSEDDGVTRITPKKSS